MNERSPSQKSAGRKRNNSGRGDAGSSKKSGAKNRGKSRSRSKKVDLAKYWGDPIKLPQAGGYTTSTPDPSVVINSLGRPPIPGHENASKHYFNLVYERATNLAVALAAAGGLNDPVQADPSDPDNDRDLSDANNTMTEPEPTEQP